MTTKNHQSGWNHRNFQQPDAPAPQKATTGDTMWKKRKRMLDAGLAMSAICGEALADKAAGFTCDEAEATNGFLLAYGNTTWAEEFRLQHVEGDDDEDDRHHGGWEVNA